MDTNDGSGRSEAAGGGRFSLRQELRTHPGPSLSHGAPTWTIHDPVRHRFFRIGWMERIIMDHPNLSPESLVQRVKSQGGPAVDPEQVIKIRDFLVQNELVAFSDRGRIKALMHRKRKRTQGWIKKMWHGWLFFRVPLWNPDAFLRRFSWLWGFFAHPITWVGLLLMGVVGVINTARHWDMFLGTFPHFFSIQGWLWTSGAILGAKLVHEFGHAATAYRWGCRVPSMGVAFMLFWPVFYSDVGEAWLLRSRKGRLQIGAGGVVAELGLAALALFFWPFLPDGPARSAMVLLAGVVWVGTVAINLNPFMRFDGYFLLADALGVPNLQQQAFALGQWHLREWLFAWGVPQPQGVEGRLRGGLTVFAYAIWIYRAIFYTAFALLVYFLLFKVAGLLMLIAEVGWFVLRPVALEMGVWWRNRRLFHWNWRLAVTLPVLIGILVLLTLFPWQGSVIAPAMARAGWYQPMFAPVPAQLLHLGVKPDQEVVFRQELMVFQAPDLELSLEQNRIKTTRLRWQLDHEAGQLIPGDNPLVLRRELAAALSEREGLLQEQTLLRVQAPFAGRIKLLAEGLQPGVWVSREQPLVAVMRPQPVRVEAFVSEEEIGRLSGDSMAIFVPADLQLPSRPLKVERIENQAIEFISDVALASTFGGPLAARQDRSGRLVSEKACFRVWLIPESPWPDLDRVIPGSVKFSVAPRTIPELLWHPVWAALIRQTDF